PAITHRRRHTEGTAGRVSIIDAHLLGKPLRLCSLLRGFVLLHASAIASYARNASGESFITQETQQRWDQGERHNNCNGHGSGGSETHRCEEANIGYNESEKRDKDRGTGEDHRRTGGACSHTGGIGAVFRRTFRAVPRQNEQGVVNAHSQADHYREDWSDVVEFDPVGSNK